MRGWTGEERRREEERNGRVEVKERWDLVGWCCGIWRRDEVYEVGIKA